MPNPFVSPAGGLLAQNPNFWQWLMGIRPTLATDNQPTRADGIVMRSDYDPRVPNRTPNGGEEPTGQWGGLLGDLMDPAALRRQSISQGLLSAGAGIATGRGWGDSIARGAMGFSEGYQGAQDRALDRAYMGARLAEMGKPDGRSRTLTPAEEIALFGKDLPGTFQEGPSGDVSLIRGSEPPQTQDVWGLLNDADRALAGFPAGSVVSRNSGTGAYHVDYQPPAPDRPRAPTDFELRGNKIDQMYPKDSPEWRGAWNRLLLGDTGPTDAQVANNAEIDAARKRLDRLGLDGTALMAAMQRQSDTGMDNPDYNPQIAHVVTLAGQHKVGEDADFEKYQSLFTPASASGGGDLGGTAAPAAGAGAIPQAAIDFLRANPQLQADFDAKYGPGSAARYLLGGR